MLAPVPLSLSFLEELAQIVRGRVLRPLTPRLAFRILSKGPHFLCSHRKYSSGDMCETHSLLSKRAADERGLLWGPC